MEFLHEAKFYSLKDSSKVKCILCPNLCTISPGEKGRCNVRININGKLYTMNYGLLTTGSRDPIEKKPLYHFLPGSCSYSFGSIGCNLFCQFCQNWHISRADPEKNRYGLKKLSPETAVKEAILSGCASVSYTYNEPFVWYEWVFDTAKQAKRNGLKNVLVTNGYIEEEPLQELLPYIDAANVDIKGDKNFYKNLCKVSHQEAVLRTCKIMKKNNIHLEVTNLVIPGENDSINQLQELIDFVRLDLDKNTPLHFSKYFPNYHLNLPPTPESTLIKAREMALNEGLHYVYLGNIRDTVGNDTHCKNCTTLLIRRRGYSINIMNLSPEKNCQKCNTPVDVVWQ